MGPHGLKGAILGIVTIKFYSTQFIYTQYALPVLLFNLEKKIFEIYTFFGIMGQILAIIGPWAPWGPHLPFDYSLCPTNKDYFCHI